MPAGPSETAQNLITATASEVMSYAIKTNNNPTGFAATGLPAGVSLDPLTGLISGTPTVAGIFDVEIEAVGPDGTVIAHLVLVSRSAEGVVFDNSNPAEVSSDPGVPTQFTLSSSTCIMYVMDYHLFNGGRSPGTIALRHEDGTTYGPWQTTGRIEESGVNEACWEAWPNAWLKPGSYTVLDSHNPSWSYIRVPVARLVSQPIGEQMDALGLPPFPGRRRRRGRPDSSRVRLRARYAIRSQSRPPPPWRPRGSLRGFSYAGNDPLRNVLCGKDQYRRGAGGARA